MGKMNLSKTNKRANRSSKGSSGIPNWVLTSIIVVIIVAVLLTTAMTILNSTGLIMRVSDAVESENFEVSGNMMTYFYANTYSNFSSTYSSLLSSLSVAKAGTMADHKNITIGSTTADQTYFSAYEGKTWFDYFMDMTVDSVKSMLIYCEESLALGITYTDKDRQDAEDAIDATISQFRINLALQGGSSTTSEDTCFTMMYGAGVKRSDILDAMELSTLASKCSEKIQNDLEKKVTIDRINKEYTDNQLDYDVIDYFYYEYSVKYDDVVKEVAGKDATEAQIKEKKDEIVAEYKKQIEEVKEITKKLAAATTLDEFKKIIFDDIAYDKYDELLSGKDLKDDKMPAKDDLATFKDKIVTAVIEEALKGDEKTTDEVKEETTGEGNNKTTTYTLYGTTVTSEFAKAIRSVRESLFTALDRINGTYDIDKSNYSKDDDFKKWAFDAQRKDGETKSIAKGDGASDGEFKVKENSYTEKVYFLEKAQYKLEKNTRNFTYMLLSSTDTAKKAIEAIKKYVDGGKTLTVEKFNEIATEYKAAYNATVDNYIEGNMGSTAFDEWLFDDELKKGAYTAESISMSDGSILVAMYEEEGEPTWKTIVKNSILNEDYTAREDKMTAKYGSTISVSDWVVARVGD